MMSTQTEEKTNGLKLFNKYDCSGVTVNDAGLKNYITIKPMIVPKSSGRTFGTQFKKSNMHIVERLITHIFVPGHKGKTHTITSGHCTGKYENGVRIVREAFQIIEEKTKQNPVEVLVRAVEKAAIREEITAYQIGGIIARKAVITSPQRRVDAALRLITQGEFRKSHKNKRSAGQALAEELIAASKGDVQASFAVSEKERIEREAAGAR